MPRFNRRGDILMGVGDTQPSVLFASQYETGRRLATRIPGVVGGGGAWLTLESIVQQDTSGPPQIVRIGVQADAEVGLRVMAREVLASRPATEVVAGDGVWAVWGDVGGYLDSFPTQSPQAAIDNWVPRDAYDGWVIFKPKHQGPELRFRWNGRLVEQTAPPKWPWTCGHRDGYGLCAWPIGEETQGVVLSGDGQDHRPDLVVLPTGEVRVCSSRGAQEYPDEARIYRHVEARPRTDLTRLPLPETLGALWWGWFVYGVHTAAGHAWMQASGSPLWRDVYTTHGAVLAKYVNGEPDGDLASLNDRLAVTRRTNPGVATLGYQPYAMQIAGQIPDADIVLIEVYPKTHETAATFQRRVAASVQAVAQQQKRWAFAAQCYTSNTQNWADLDAAIRVTLTVIAAWRPWGVWWFSDGARPTGYLAHPEVHALLAAAFSTVTGPGEVVRPMPPPPAPAAPSLFERTTWLL